MKLIAPEYFENGDAAVETVCHHIDKWQLPCPGHTLQLPVLGTVLQVSFTVLHFSMVLEVVQIFIGKKFMKLEFEFENEARIRVGMISKEKVAHFSRSSSVEVKKSY